MRTLTGKTRIAGVFGWPVDHSRSPRLHGYWLRQLGIDGAYIPFATHPTALEQAVRSLPAFGFRGGNVTLPHKERVLPLVDEATPVARRIGAVNTLVVREDGTILGDNTDGYGFLAHLAATQPGWRGAAGPACVLGAGGAAR
ncbi:MAG: shikimate dehydrogenase family protein, partial [Dongiaceae bacterium]